MHWHAFSWTGYGRPSDREARDLNAAVPPNELAQWFSKPASLRAGTHTVPEDVYGWLEAETAAHEPLGLSARVHLELARKNLGLGQDAYIAYYTPKGRAIVRAALVCPRRPPVRCPEGMS